MDEVEEIRRKRMRELMRKQKMDKAIELTDAIFNETIAKHQLVVIDCWASWCGPCKMIGPVIDELAKDYAGKIVFGKLNVDENRQIPSEYGIRSIPALLVFKDGRHVDTLVGAMSRQMLEPKITQHLDQNG